MRQSTLVQREPAYLGRLREALDELSEGELDPMGLQELDGFVAGLLLSPTPLPPSKWMRHVWGASGEHADYFPFDSFDEMRDFTDLVIHHHNAVAAALYDRYTYRPIFLPPVEDISTWTEWVIGFGRASDLSAESWICAQKSDIVEFAEACSGLMALREIVDGDCHVPESSVESLDQEFPELIRMWVRSLAAWQLRSVTENGSFQNGLGRTLHRRSPSPRLRSLANIIDVHEREVVLR